MTANAKTYFRPTLENLENREMMDAGIGGAVMHRMMPDITQGAHVRLLAQELSALQNPNNPLSQALTQANQAVLGQAQQVNANVQAAVDHIFSAWSHHVDQVVHNIPGLQAGANYQQHKDNPTATLMHNIPGLQAGANYQAHEESKETADSYGKKVADAFIERCAQGGPDNVWGIRSAKFISAKPLDTQGERYQVDIELYRYDFFSGWCYSTLSIKFHYRFQDAMPNAALVADGSEVTTHGKQDASLFLLQGLLLSLRCDAP